MHPEDYFFFEYIIKYRKIMKKSLFVWMTIVLMGAMSVSLTACGSDDDGDGGSGGSGNINPASLVGWAFEKSDEYYGSSNLETTYWTIEFKTENFVMVHMRGNGMDEDGSYRWDHGEIDCMYTVRGNQVTIDYTNDGGTQQLVLKFVKGVPEGWTVSKRGSVPITTAGSDDSSSSATAGSSQMFGYYSNDAWVNNVVMQNIRGLISAGDYNINNWKDFVESYNYGYQIVDGNTINRMYERVEVNVTGREPTGDKWYHPVVYRTEQYSGYSGRQRVTIYVYFYYLADYEATYKYVMNGSTIEVSNGTRLVYNGSKLTDISNNSTYTKR